MYYSDSDERAMFEWLHRLKAVKSVGGKGREVEIHLHRRRLSNRDLRELLALFHRYQIDERPLRPYIRSEMKWLHNPSAFWYRGLFGES